MSRICYVGGSYVHRAHATVSIEDRAALFSDAVYEVFRVIRGRIVDGDRHFQRLRRSLDGLRIKAPMTDRALVAVIDELLHRNRLQNATIYLQISRGAARRNHVFPGSAKPCLVLMPMPLKKPAKIEREAGVRVISRPDQRWARRDFKTVSLLPNVLARQDAAEAGAAEAWLLGADGQFTEASHSNTYLVDAEGRILTHPADNDILGGITRSVVLELAVAADIPVREVAFSPADVADAAEAFMTGTGSWVLPVVQVDDCVIAEGEPGPITRKLQIAYERHVFGNQETVVSA